MSTGLRLCLLHLHKRIIEIMASMVFIESLNEVEYKAVKYRMQKARKIEIFLNRTVFGTPSNKGQYHLMMDNDDQLEKILKYNDSKAQLLICVTPFLTKIV
jgi:hypothetical protein